KEGSDMAVKFEQPASIPACFCIDACACAIVWSTAFHAKMPGLLLRLSQSRGVISRSTNKRQERRPHDRSAPPERKPLAPHYLAAGGARRRIRDSPASA